MKRKFIIIGIVVVIFGGIAYQLAANKKIINERKEIDHQEVVIPVTTTITSYQEVNHQLIKTGTLIPFKEADITAASAGKLVQVNFKLGDYVSRGALLASIDNSMLNLNLKAAQLVKNKAEKDYKRAKALLAGDATTTMNFQDTKYNYENAKNKVAQIKDQISDNRIKAPLSGQIITKEKETGEYVSPGAILGHVVAVDRLKADVMVTEQEVYHLEEGQQVKITTDIYPGVVFKGKITFISEKGDEVHNYQVEVTLNNRKDYPLRSGSFANVDFEQKNHVKRMLIPKSALIQSLDNPMVYVIDSSGKAAVKQITPGDSYENNIAVIKGLNPGDTVITSGLINITAGTPVKSVKK